MKEIVIQVPGRNIPSRGQCKRPGAAEGERKSGGRRGSQEVMSHLQAPACGLSGLGRPEGVRERNDLSQLSF